MAVVLLMLVAGWVKERVGMFSAMTGGDCLGCAPFSGDNGGANG